MKLQSESFLEEAKPSQMGSKLGTNITLCPRVVPGQAIATNLRSVSVLVSVALCLTCHDANVHFTNVLV